MIRYQTRKAEILFVGINPHPGSYRRGVPFSNNKLFWYLLQRAGLIREKIEDLRDDFRLGRMYRDRFNKVYRLGFVNLIDRPTRDVTLLRKGEERNGRRRVGNILRRQKPGVVCFVGKITYGKYAGTRDFTYGWQAGLGPSRIFVMHFPLRGKADVRVRELRRVGRARKRRTSGGRGLSGPCPGKRARYRRNS